MEKPIITYEGEKQILLSEIITARNAMEDVRKALEEATQNSEDAQELRERLNQQRSNIERLEVALKTLRRVSGQGKPLEKEAGVN